jgi:hypothetical protein
LIKINPYKLYVLFFINLHKFIKYYTSNFFFQNKLITKTHFKKTLFFKKKPPSRVLVSRRLGIILKKRKNLVPRGYRFTTVKDGDFFFKKSFYKSVIKHRKLIKGFFFLNTKVRQKKISRRILLDQKQLLHKNSNYEFTVLNIVLRSHFCLFLVDALLLIKRGFFYINGVYLNKVNLMLNTYDCLQLKLSKSVYKYIKDCKKLLKRKNSLIKRNTWLFYKQKDYKKEDGLKPKKRKIPKYIILFYLFKLNTPKFLEIDYPSLTIFLLKSVGFNLSSYYLNKIFSFKLFPLYNYKKIN